MGNYVSCTLSAAPLGCRQQSRGVKVVLPSGDVRHFKRQATAAELMLEAPNHFLVNARSLQIGRRFCALSADEELEMHDVYAMFPMRRVNSLVTSADMDVLFLGANSAFRRVSGVGKVRILPDPSWVPSLQVAEDHKTDLGLSSLDDEGGSVVGEFKYRATVRRSRRPRLDTILEESSVCST